MPISREWLSWDEPCLPQAAVRLIDHYAQQGVCDLQDVVCVLPGARAGRMLLSELIKRCDGMGLRLHPPRVLTPGAMVDELLEEAAGEAEPVAGAYEAHLAWMRGLREMAESDAGAIAALLPTLPAPDDVMAWNDLARTFVNVHETLAGELKGFDDAADAAERLGMAAEGERWRAMALIHAQQRAALRRAGLVDRHDARRGLLDRAIARSQRGESPQCCVWLVGVSDLNAAQRAVLNLASLTVVALVHAPESRSDMFDALGTVRAEAWASARIDLSDDIITVVERASDQAQAALRFVAECASDAAASDITLGLGDPALLGDLRVAGAWAGVSIHDPLGAPLARSGPARLLHAALDWIEDRRFEHLAALLRHPDVERWVARTANVAHDTIDSAVEASSAQIGRLEWLTLLDRYFNDHLQGRLTGAWLGDDRMRGRLKAVHDAVNSLLAPLLEHAERSRPLHEWCQPMLDVLANAYAIESDQSDAGRSKTIAAPLPSVDATLALRDVIAEIAHSDARLQPATTAAQALRMALDVIARTDVPQDREVGSIEALGWLELHLDVAPNLAIIGFNEGAVPETVVGHAFLPDGLRSALGLMNNTRRYARDAYLLSAIVNSRRRLGLIVGRRSPQGDPLAPSRLLLACEHATLAQRVIDFAEDRSEVVHATPMGLPRIGPGVVSGFSIPALPPLAPPTSMRVTDFRAYLQSPYRYALERRIGLEAIDDRHAELDPLSFGSLVHAALATLGEDAQVAASDDPEVVFDHLRHRLRDIVRARYGSNPLPALRVQVAHIEQRLRSFAKCQAKETRDGWRIQHCEISFAGQVALDVPGQEPMPLRGQIDRIDFHERERRWRVLDYKTGESAKSPMKAHHDRETPLNDSGEVSWIDLQLPLYHLLVTRGPLALPAEQVTLGYMVLPKQSDSVKYLQAEWSAEHLEHGVETARAVVRAIRSGAFSERGEEIDPKFDAFARICQTAAFKADDHDEGEGDE